MIKTITLSIAGMHCSSCEKLIGSELDELSGIEHYSISEPEKGGSVTFDDSRLSFEDVLAAVKVAGYDAVVVDEKERPSGLLRKLLVGEQKQADIPAVPRHIRVELQTVADGSVSIDSMGRPVFTGTMSDTKSITVDGKEQGASDYEFTNQAVAATSIMQALSAVFVPKNKADGRELPAHSDADTVAVSSGTAAVTTRLAIYGMHCSSCAGLIEKQLSKVHVGIFDTRDF